MENQDHATRIREALERYQLANRPLAVEEPANDFEKAVNNWEELQALLTEMKSLLKPLETDERKARNGIAESLITFFGDSLKEGVNNYELSNMRKLKFTHRVDRKIDNTMVPIARAAYDAAADKPDGVPFDDMLRVKYELPAAPYKKLAKGSASYLAVQRMLTTKFASPVVVVD